MKQDRINVKIVPDIRRLNTDLKFSLKLRITYKRERKYCATGLNVSSAQWEVINSAEVKGKLHKMRLEMAEIETKALECIAAISPFSYLAFEREFFRSPSSTNYRTGL